MSRGESIVLAAAAAHGWTVVDQRNGTLELHHGRLVLVVQFNGRGAVRYVFLNGRALAIRTRAEVLDVLRNKGVL